MRKLILNFKFSILKKSSGLTLIELLIFMGIFSVLLIVLFQLFISVFDVQLEAQSTSSVEQDGRFIMAKLTADIRNATSSSILLPVTGTQGHTLVISNGAISYTYALSNGNIILSATPSGTVDQLNSVNTSVSSVSFLRLSDTDNQYNTITVNFTLNSRVVRRGGVNSQNFEFTAGTR